MNYTSFQILKVYCEEGCTYYAKVKLIGERTKRVTLWLGDPFPTEEIIKKVVEDHIEREKMDAIQSSWVKSIIGKVIDL